MYDRLVWSNVVLINKYIVSCW